MATEKPYNPLDYDNLTLNLIRELMSREPVPLPLPETFPGSGVYALFYNGNFKPYAALCSPDADVPIYVGKAVPPGARKGGTDADFNSPALFGRIREHASSIEAGQNLDLSHFRCRYLVVVPLWITMAERFLIEHYQASWNVCLEGFGNHDPGKGRYEQEASWWDVLHPGRSWAEKLNQNRTAEQAVELLSAHLSRKGSPPETP